MQRLITLTLSVLATSLLLGTLFFAAAPRGHAEQSSADIDLWMKPLGLSFGPVNIGDTSAPQTITLTNVGARTIPGFTPQRPADPQFQLTTDCTDGLPPAASCTYVVRFAPTAPGRVSTSSTTETTVAVFTFNMSGIGVTPSQSYDVRLLDFGALPVGAESTAQAARVRNVGRSAITDFTNPPPSDSQFSAADACLETLMPGADCTYALDFRPTRVGSATAHFTPESSGGPMDIELIGWASPPFRVNARALDFGAVISGTVSRPLSVTLENLTVVPLTNISHTAPVNTQFQVTTDCADTLAPGGICTLYHSFAPTRTGQGDDVTALSFRVGALDVTEAITVGLRGAGCTPDACTVAPITVNPPMLDLGTAAMGTQSLPAAVAITNNSAYTVTFTGSAVSDPQFLVARTCGAALPPGMSCSGSVRLRPFQPGAASAQANTNVQFTEAGGSIVMTGTYTLALQGFGIPGFTYSPRVIDFPPTGVGETAPPITVTVRSLGGTLAGFNGVDASAPFTNTTDCSAGVTAFGVCHDVIRFAPTTSLTYTVTRGVGTTLGLYELVISGEGKEASLWATPTVLNFGTITAGRISAPQQVTVVNVGLAPMTFTAPPMPENDQFLFQSDCPASLAPEATCTLTYRFKPTAVGSQDTKASIDTNGGQRRIDLWGYAVEGTTVDPPHHIFLPSVRDD